MNIVLMIVVIHNVQSIYQIIITIFILIEIKERAAAPAAAAMKPTDVNSRAAISIQYLLTIGAGMAHRKAFNFNNL